MLIQKIVMRSTAETFKILHNTQPPNNSHFTPHNCSHHQVIQYFTHKKSQWLTRLHGTLKQVHLLEWWSDVGADTH